MALHFIGQSEDSHILAGIFPLDNQYLAGKPLLLVRGMLVNFGDILSETDKNSACWDMGGNSHLTRLSSDSLYKSQRIELELGSIYIREYWEQLNLRPPSNNKTRLKIMSFECLL